MTDDDKALNARTELLLTGDDGGCLAADGTERLDRIKRALWETEEDNWLKQEHYRQIRDEARIVNLKFSSYAWHHRHGKPWQADIERHVSQYRADPRDFVNDLDLCRRELWPKIREAVTANGREYSLSLTEWPNGWNLNYPGCTVINDDDENHTPRRYATPERAIVAAFLAVCKREKEVSDESTGRS